MDYAQVFETMVQETQKYLENNNLWAMILGISGGLDSTVTAAICHEVEKRNPDIKFIGVSLPCYSNKKDENDSAEACMKAFCKDDQYYTENIQKEYMLMRSTCSMRHSMTTIGCGNIKARLRMTILYNEANYFSGLVMDTDNLTEHFLGFYTLHGDMNDLNPIGGLWKHEVYELAKYLVKRYSDELSIIENNLVRGVDEKESLNQKIAALNRAIDIRPTDGNGINPLGDMGQIAPAFAELEPYEAYKRVDDILAAYIEYKGHHPEEYQIEMERLYSMYGKETVDGVIHRHNKTEYKRKPLPVVIDRKLYEKI